MILQCIGHAKFLLEFDDGHRIITDPYDAACGFDNTPIPADTVLISHHHHDHDAVDTVPGVTKVIDTPGCHTIAPHMIVRAYPAYHDDVQGKKRGETLTFLIEAEGLRIAHLGDLGHLPTPEMVKAFAPVDLLMVPVGGYYTLDPHQALETCRLLQARVILPMHYRTCRNPDFPVAPVDDFLRLTTAKAETLDLLRVTEDDLCEVPPVVVLRGHGC